MPLVHVFSMNFLKLSIWLKHRIKTTVNRKYSTYIFLVLECFYECTDKKSYFLWTFFIEITFLWPNLSHHPPTLAPATPQCNSELSVHCLSPFTLHTNAWIFWIVILFSVHVSAPQISSTSDFIPHSTHNFQFSINRPDPDTKRLSCFRGNYGRNFLFHVKFKRKTSVDENCVSAVFCIFTSWIRWIEF